MSRVARPEIANKRPSNKKSKYDRRLTPRQCQEVRTHWTESREKRIKEREEAELEGRSFAKSVNSYDLPWNVSKTLTVERAERRNPGRADGKSWNADSYICGGLIDDNFYDRGCGSEELAEDVSLFGSEVEESTSRLLPSISLTDMMRAAKPIRDKTHEFVMVPTVSRVIVPDDYDSTLSYEGWEDDLEYWEEEWEQLQGSADSQPSQLDQGHMTQKTYAQAVRVEVMRP